MKINSINNTNFKGYDARHLKGFLMNSNNGGIATEMLNIGRKEGFEIYSVTKNSCKRNVISPQKEIIGIWAQDFWTILEESLLFKNFNDLTQIILKKFKVSPNEFQEKIRKTPECIKLIQDVIVKQFEIEEYFNSGDYDIEILKEKGIELKSKYHSMHKGLATKHIPGGNIFITLGEKGNELLVGEDELQEFTPDEIMNLYSVNKITIIPQMDYHLDLFIRPLNNMRVLLTDDNLSLKVFEKAINKLQHYTKLHNNIDYLIKDNYLDLIEFYNNFKNNIKENKNPQTDAIEKILRDSGYEVIRVPGRIYETHSLQNNTSSILRHRCNYINANCLLNKKNELVYITNKSNIDDDLLSLVFKITGVSFENEFAKAISPFIKKEHLYFIEGNDSYVSEEMLWYAMGGIHCACSEIPLDIGENYDQSSTS